MKYTSTGRVLQEIRPGREHSSQNPARYAGVYSVPTGHRSEPVPVGYLSNLQRSKPPKGRPLSFKRLKYLFFKTPLLFRVLAGVIALIFFAETLFPVLNAYKTENKYDLSQVDTTILSTPVDLYSQKLTFDKSTKTYKYNDEYTPGSGAEVSGESYAPKIRAEFGDKDKGITVVDPVTNTSVKFMPQFNVAEPRKDQNRIVYPIQDRNATSVYTTRGIGVKEDIIVHKFDGDQMEFKYELKLSPGTEARQESDGSIGIYGVSSELLGNVATGSEADAQLLEKARENGQKNKLIFTIPKPVVLERYKKLSKAKATYSLANNILTISAYDLDKANYPLTVDPSVYVESARQLMRGNNETNVDFDTENELIQKSQTTGARIDAWEGTQDSDQGSWDGGTAAAGGYIYRAGGRTGLEKPQIVSQQSSSSTGTASFQMSMPSERPAGDLYVAMLCHDGTGSVTAPAGWTQYANIREHAAYYKVGTDQGGGNEASSYTFTGGNVGWYGVIIRVTGFNASDPVSGTPATGSNGSNVIPVFPATTPDNDATLVIRAAGADNDPPSVTGWVPAGHTKIDSGTSGGTNDCGFAAASLDTPPASGVSTGTATLADNSLNDSYGASSIAINPDGSPLPPQIQDQQSTIDSSDGTSFTMDMPATRPAGDLYIAMMCVDENASRNNTVTAPGGSGWTEFADVGEYAAYWKIGTDAGGGNEAANYTWTISSSEKAAGVIIRISGFDSSDPISGTPGTGDSGGTNSRPQFPATTPDNNSTLVIRAAGADNDTPSATGWVPAGHTKIYSANSGGGTGTCAFMSAALDVSPLSGVSTGSVQMGDNNVNDQWGSSSIAINPQPSTSVESTLTSVEWAQFNASSLAIESPNPGTGVCSGWCSDPEYALPSGRRGFSMVAYNGYLYVIGGVDSAGNRVSTIYIAKLGANGEPQLWHPTDPNKDNWVYWYTGTGAALNGGTAKSYMGAVATNNRLYIIGGQTNASPGGVTTVEKADILPNGIVGTWTTSGMQALPSGAGTHMQSVQVYNDTIYNIGGFEGAVTSTANLRSAVYYSKLETNGNMNSWQLTNGISTARATFGSSFSTIWGAYIYLGGGCSAVNGSGYCTTVQSDMQIVSINADGSLGPWGSLGGLENVRIGYTLIGWQGGLYRVGGCTIQNGSSGVCGSTLADVDYGVVNPAGEVSTVNVSTASGVGNCDTPTYTNCDLPPPGDAAGQAGNMLSMTTVLNGYLYAIGGCTDYDCSGTSPGSTDISGNIAYVAINSTGSLGAPPSCSGTSYGAWCVESTNRINGTTGVAAGGVTTFNGRIYVVGGVDNTSDGSTEIYYTTPDISTGRPSAWSNTSFATAGLTGEIAYTYAYARANPSSAGSNPGNLYIFGGCGDVGTGPGCSGSNYRTQVYKCNIAVAGSINGCTTTGQLQIDSTPGTGSSDGLGTHSGTVYANYIYLIGGISQAETDKDDVLYAKFDNNNNVVAVSGSDWIESPNKLSIGRRRGFSFGYNGHIYSVGGYDDDGSTLIPFIEWSKMNVSDGSIDAFVKSSVTINQRWGLSMAVSNSYAYVIGGCNAGISPSGCSSFERQVQTFQLYNNDSGSPVGYSASANQFGNDRIGASSAVLNGYLYVAGGCTGTSVVSSSNSECNTPTTSVQYASLDAYGNVSSWSAGGNLPAARAWGQLETAGGSLYYVGGQDSSGAAQADVYYTTGISSGNPTFGTASNGLPAARTQHGAAVWDDRIYVIGGNNSSGTTESTVYYSPKLSSGGNITSTWNTSTSVNVARSGATLITYANNLYVLGGYDGSNYLNDVQFAALGYKTGTITQSGNTITGSGTTFTSSMVGLTLQYNADGETATITGYTSATSITVTTNKTISSPVSYVIHDGSVGSWSYTTSLPGPIRQGDGFAANGYIYLVGGRSSDFECSPNTLVAPISANTTIASGNNPTGVGEWYETNQRYTGDRYGAAVSYSQGKIYTLGGGCQITPTITPTVTQTTTGNSTTHNVTMPATVDSGDLLLVLVSLDTSTGAGANVNTPAGGWASLYNTGNGTNVRGAAFVKDADGTEDGATVNFSSTASESFAAQVYRVPAAQWEGTISNGVTAGTAVTANTANPDPPSLDPANWGAENTLWIAATAGSTYTGISSLPSGYGDSFHTNSATGTDAASISSGRLASTASSENPGTFTMTPSAQQSVTNTIAIRPSVAVFTGSNRATQTAVYSQPQVARYSRLIDADSDVFPNSWLLNGLDNSVGARWQVRYRSMNDTDGIPGDCGSADMTTWGQETNFGDTLLYDVNPYVPKDGSGNNIQCARYFYFYISIDASQTFGYPEDVARGPTITDLSLFFTSDPNKRLRHGKTFTGGEQQPLDTPCRQSVDSDCPLP